MDSDAFLTLAELSLALIGFSALVAVFRRGGALNTFRIRQLVEIALTAFGMSLLPVLLETFGLAGGRLWRACSFAGGVLVIWHVSFGFRRLRRVAPMALARRENRAALVAASLAFLLGVLNLANASAWFWHPAAGPYTASVIAQLGAACVFFVIEFFKIGEDGSAA